MDYRTMAGMMLSNEKNPQHWQHIIEFAAMCEQAIRDLTPQIVREELAKLKIDLPVQIQTQINGQKKDFPDVAEYIIECVANELSKR